MMRFLIGIAAASIALLGATGGNQTAAHLSIHTRGCGASHPNEPIYLSFWQANHYPGVGDEAARRIATDQRVNIALPAGYYRVMLFGRGCWEQAQWFSLIAGKPRNVVVQFESFRAASNVDYDMYYTPRGSVAGIIPLGKNLVQIIPIHGGKSNRTSTAVVEDGAYYADVVTPGHYVIRVLHNNAVAEKRVLIIQDHLTQANFSEASFRTSK